MTLDPDAVVFSVEMAAPGASNPDAVQFAHRLDGFDDDWVEDTATGPKNDLWVNAVDLNTGELKWKVPLGEYRELSARGTLNAADIERNRATEHVVRTIP